MNIFLILGVIIIVLIFLCLFATFTILLVNALIANRKEKSKDINTKETVTEEEREK